MDNEATASGSKPVLQLFQEAWEQLNQERPKGVPVDKVEIVTRNGEKKHVNGYEFWKIMMEEVEEQKRDPNYVFKTPIPQKKIEKQVTETMELESGEVTSSSSNIWFPSTYHQNDNCTIQDFLCGSQNVNTPQRVRKISLLSNDDEKMRKYLRMVPQSEEERERKDRERQDRETNLMLIERKRTCNEKQNNAAEMCSKKIKLSEELQDISTDTSLNSMPEDERMES